MVNGLGYAADGELRGPVGTLDAGLGGRAEAGVDGEGEVDGGSPAHAEAWGTDAGDDVDGRRDGNFEVSRGVSGDVGLGLFWFDVIEERDVVVRDAAQREAEAGCVVEVLDDAAGSREFDVVQESLAVEVGGEVNLQEGDDGCAQGYRARAGEAYPRVEDREDLDAQLRQRAEAGHEVLLPSDGRYS